MSDAASVAFPSVFHHFLDRLAESGRLLRLYTQNVDCIESSLPSLSSDHSKRPKDPWPTTVQLHGRVDRMYCQRCQWHGSLVPELFQGAQAPLCEECKKVDLRRNKAGLRPRGIGWLRPQIVLYDEYHPDDIAIWETISHDLRQRPDAVIVVGTSLKVFGARSLARKFCRAVRCRKNGVTSWINLEKPSLGRDNNLWDCTVQGDCDKVATMLSTRIWDY